MQVVVGNPLGQIDDPGTVSPEIATRAAVALGLALDAPGGAR